MVMLSGLWTLPESMPPWLGTLMLLSPVYYLSHIAYGVLLKGAGLTALWDSIISMTTLGMVTFGFGVWRFRKQFD